MKDPAHHNDKTQRKVLREVRQSEEEIEENLLDESQAPPPLEEEAGVEVEEQNLWIRPSQRNSH